MNRELIKKYKKEFNFWLDNPHDLLFKSNIDKESQWRKLDESGDDWTWTDHFNNKIQIVINDDYVEFRKALAEGKEVETRVYYSEYPSCLQNAEYRNEWHKFTEKDTFFGPSKYYRIKPEEVIEVKEPEIKIGDFVRVKPFNDSTRNNVIKKVKNINFVQNTVSTYVFDDKTCAFERCVKLWKPTEKELCWFRNSKWSKPEESIVTKYSKDLEEYYDLIEPYINDKLPSWIKQ